MSEMSLPTVKVKGPKGSRIINERDFDPARHELFDAPQAVTDTTVGKGPRGRWYVKRGKQIIAGPFETEDEARGADL